jgi:hypothetical protein
MTPEVLIERLLALVPRPRRHLVTYHGVFAPASGLRARIVPRWAEEEVGGEAEALSSAEEEGRANAIEQLRRRRRVVPHAPGPRGRRRGGVRRDPWAELLRRVFEVEVLVCAHCGGARRLRRSGCEQRFVVGPRCILGQQIRAERPAGRVRGGGLAGGDWTRIVVVEGFGWFTSQLVVPIPPAARPVARQHAHGLWPIRRPEQRWRASGRRARAGDRRRDGGCDAAVTH